MRQIVVDHRSDSLGAVTAATRAAAEFELAGLGRVMQVWTWRNGEAVVLYRQGAVYVRGEPVVILRRGLRRGQPVTIRADSLASALRSLGLASRVRTRRAPAWRSPPSWRAQQRRPLLAAIHARGNRWRTLVSRVRKVASELEDVA